MPQQEEKQRVPKRLDEGGRSVIRVFNPIVMDIADVLSMVCHGELAPAAVVANGKQVIAQIVDAVLKRPHPSVRVGPEAEQKTGLYGNIILR